MNPGAGRRSTDRTGRPREYRTRVEPSDEELMVQVQAGSEGALGSLVERWRSPLFGFLARRAGPNDADDLFQETWLRVVRARRRFDPRAALLDLALPDREQPLPRPLPAQRGRARGPRRRTRSGRRARERAGRRLDLERRLAAPARPAPRGARAPLLPRSRRARDRRAARDPARHREEPTARGGARAARRRGAGSERRRSAARRAPRGAARTGAGAERRRSSRARSRVARAELRAGPSAVLARAGSARRCPPPPASRSGSPRTPPSSGRRGSSSPRCCRPGPPSLAVLLPALYAFGAVGWLGVFFGALPFVAHQRLVRRLREVPT